MMSRPNSEGCEPASCAPPQTHIYPLTDFASVAPLAQDLSYTDKARATLAAMLAIKGYSLHLLADGSFLASKWNCTKHLPSLYAVQGFARQVGAI